MSTRNYTTEEKAVIDSVMKDFVKRDGQTFVNIRREDREKWNETFRKGGSCSGEFVTIKDEVHLMRKSYSLAKNTIKSLNPPFKVSIDITPSSEDSYTDSKKVCIATNYFDDNRFNNGQKVDIFLGLTIHETCHLLYTDFSMRENEKIIHHLYNIVEDERIENILGDECPGLMRYLASVKYFYFSPKMQKACGGDTPNTIGKLMHCILSMVRYPERLNTDYVLELAEPLLKIKNVLSALPEDCKGSHNYAHKIYDIIKDYFKEEIQKEQQEQQNQKNNGNGSDTNQEGQTSQNTADGTGNSKTGTSELSDKELDKKAEERIRSQFGDIEENIQEICGQENESLDGERMSQKLRDANNEKIVRGTVEEGLYGSMIESMENNISEYEKAKKRIKPYINSISRIIDIKSERYRLSLKGLRHGTLDEVKIAEAVQGVPTVYMRHGIVKYNKLAVCILIDQSGSMHGNKISSAMDCAVLLNESIGRLPNVELFIYGHNNDRKNHIYVYREGDRKYNKYSIGSMIATGCNHDSKSINEVVARVRKRTKEKVLFFVINDGQPCESNGERLVKEAVEKAERLDFNTIGIGIEFRGDENMFPKRLDFEKATDFVTGLAKLIRKTTDRNMKKSMTI